MHSPAASPLTGAGFCSFLLPRGCKNPEATQVNDWLRIRPELELWGCGHQHTYSLLMSCADVRPRRFWSLSLLT